VPVNESNSTGGNNNSEMETFAINSPINGSTYNDSVFINITNGNMTEVNYSIDNGQMVNYTGVANVLLSAGLHNITVMASDSTIFSEVTIYFMIVNTTLPQNDTGNNQSNETNTPGNNNVNNNGNGGGGSGGSSSSSKLFRVTSSATVSGYTQTLGAKDKIQFSLIGETGARHVLMINSVSNNSVSFRVENIVFNLGVGETARFNLTSAKGYDLEVTVNSISNGKVNVTVKAINASIPQTLSFDVENGNSVNAEVGNNNDEDTNTESQVSSAITGNAVSETETEARGRGIFRVFNFIQNIFRNMFGSIGGIFNK